MMKGLLSTISILAFCATAYAASEPPKPQAIVFTQKIKAEELFDLLTYPARISPKISTTLLSETDGIVRKILAPLGQKVKRGQKIMTITHTDPVYQYAPTPVFAPVSGIVSLVNVTEGTQVAKGDKLALVTDPGKIRIDVEIPASDLAVLKSGMEGEFKLPTVEKPVSVRIRGVSPFVDPATGTASCELEVTNAGQTLLPPGVIGQVSFKANDRKGISIPEFAIFYHGTDTLVRVVKDGRAKQVPVVLGQKNRGNVEILKGLDEGSQLVERTSRYIQDDESVTVQ